jgi:hypothetical protein
MKVLKRPNTAWSMKHTCSQCTAELEVEKGDVKFTSYPGDYRDPGYDTWTANCPICSNVFHIKEAALPKAVQIEIKKGLASPGTSYPFDR